MTNESTSKQSDLMIWVAAGAVVAIGATWLLLASPWSSSTPDVEPVVDTAARERGEQPGIGQPAALPASTPSAGAGGRSALDDPLRLAELAYEAGMLVEPEDYSAWTLFGRALEADETSEPARQGLERVADDLLQRAEVALEQGRYDDAEATSARILAALPEHAGALALAEQVEATRPPPARPTPAVATPEPELQARSAPAAAPAPVITEAPPEPAVDRIEPLHEAFVEALAANRLLTPADVNARHYVERMWAEDSTDRRSIEDRDLLVTELLSRSTQAVEALDWDAARTWIDQAERLDADPTAIAAQRSRLTDRLIAMEGARPISASELMLRNYVAPEYPRVALNRDIEGWVDVEFTVSADGSTRDIDIADASHERMFREEAMTAVARWEFEPRVFMDRPIDQRTYTRLRFVLD